jgi:hypothetical protein
VEEIPVLREPEALEEETVDQSGGEADEAEKDEVPS